LPIDGLPVADWLPIADCGLPIADCGLGIGDCGLPIADRLPPLSCPELFLQFLPPVAVSLSTEVHKPGRGESGGISVERSESVRELRSSCDLHAASGSRNLQSSMRNRQSNRQSTIVNENRQ
jgi:hypothetical protein